MLSELLTLTDKASYSVLYEKVDDHVEDLNLASTDTQSSGREHDALSSTISSGEAAVPFCSSDSCASTNQTNKLNISRDLVKDDVIVTDVGYEKAVAMKQHKPKSLPQGQNLSQSIMSGNSSADGSCIIAEKYQSGERQRIYKEKMKPLQQQRAKHPQIFRPIVVKNTRKEASVDTISTQTNVNTTATALVTSAAVAPFIQIQNALENQISSLVSTLQNAHATEKEFLTKTVQLKNTNEDRLVGKLEHVVQEIGELKKSAVCQHQEWSRKPRSTPLHEENVIFSEDVSGSRTLSKTHDRPRAPSEYNYMQKERNTKPSKKLLQITKPASLTDSSSSISRVSLLQTPVPRKKAPIPVSCGSTQVEKSNPRLSRKGVALLQEIMKNTSSPSKVDILSQRRDAPPQSHPTPIIASRFDVYF